MRRKSKLRMLLLAAIAGMGALIISTLNMGDNLVYFYTPAEALSKTQDLQDKTIRLGAMVKTGTLKWEPEQLKLQFELTDFKGHELTVRHKGTPPDLFKEGAGVVVEGRLSADGKSFTSQKMFVKHSEEYKAPDDSVVVDHELLQKSIFKDERIAPKGI